MNGKGDRPRPVDKEKWEDFFKRTGNDYCRFHHSHTADCDGYDPCNLCDGSGLTPDQTECKICKGRGAIRGL